MGSMSKQGAIEKLQQVFKDVEGDFVSIDNLLTNLDRDPRATKDINWSYNFRAVLKRYRLATAIPGKKGGQNVTLGIMLTPEGKQVVFPSQPSLLTDSKNEISDHRKGQRASVQISKQELTPVSILLDIEKMKAAGRYDMTFRELIITDKGESMT